LIYFGKETLGQTQGKELPITTTG